MSPSVCYVTNIFRSEWTFTSQFIWGEAADISALQIKRQWQVSTLALSLSQLETIVLTKRQTGTQRTENSTSSLCQLKFSGSAILMPDCRPVWSHVCADPLEEVLLTPRSVRLQPRFLSLLNFLKQFNRLAQLSAMRSHQSLLTGVEDRVLEWCDLNKWRLQLRNKTFGKKICGCEAKPDVCSCLKLGDKLIANTAWIKHGWKWKVVPV